MEDKDNIFKQNMNSAKYLLKSSMYETPIRPSQNPGKSIIKMNSNTFSVFRKKTQNIYDTGEEGFDMETKNLLFKPRNKPMSKHIEDLLKSNIALKPAQTSKKTMYMETPALEPYMKNINKMSRIGEKKTQFVYLEGVLKQVIEVYEKLKKDQIREKNLYFPGMKQDQTSPSLSNSKKEISKKQKKKLRKQLKIYDQNFCIAMSFVKALSKSLLLLTNDKHELPKEEDFNLENMISLTNLNKDIFDLCEFHDVAPLVFQRIRFYDGISNEEFIRDIGFNDFKAIFSKKMKSLKEEKSTGKSGSVFFQSANGKYFIKTIRDSEVKILKKTLKNYYSHLTNNPNSLLSRFYGLHKMRFYKNKKLKKMINNKTFTRLSMLNSKYICKKCKLSFQNKKEKKAK